MLTQEENFVLQTYYTASLIVELDKMISLEAIFLKK